MRERHGHDDQDVQSPEAGDDPRADDIWLSLRDHTWSPESGVEWMLDRVVWHGGERR